MKVLLVGPDHEENLSIRYLSASLLDAGHTTTLATFNAPVDASAVANAARSADLVGLSMCFQARSGEFLNLARRLKSDDPDKLVVAGGHYASCAAEPLLANHPEIDIVVIHEAEATLVEIAGAIPYLRERLPEIPGLAWRDGSRVRFSQPRPMLDNLDALPAPDRRGPVHWIAGVPTSYLMGSRGCYGSCAYCCITTLHRLAPGKRFRRRDVERIADEMSDLYRERGTRQFIFHDDNFLVPSEAMNHARIAGLDVALKQRGVSDIALAIKCRPADATPGVLRRLKALGLIRVFLGVESATALGLSTLERNQSVDDSVRALEACAALGISAQFTLMTFHPDSTLATLRADVAFMRRFCGNPLNFCRTEIYAGTPLETRMIELGRAHGDYRARAYGITDPVAELACNTSLSLFRARCSSNGSLMQNAIGLDHASAVLQRFYTGAPRDNLACRVEQWLRAVNLDTIDLLDQVIERSASTGGRANAAFQAAVVTLTRREAITRREFLSEAMALRVDLQALRLPGRTRTVAWLRLVKPAAAALLAIAVPSTPSAQQPPARQNQTAPQACSFAGRVIDPSGAVVPNTKITITNLETRVSVDFTTGPTGEYVAKGLSPGEYSIKADQSGFKRAVRTPIVLKAGDCERIDVGLSMEVGCCEYAADAIGLPKAETSLRARSKPFAYVVGTSGDDDTLRGIAMLVYGNSAAWISIFESNRGVVSSGTIPYGTSILIPPRKRTVPKLVHKVAPVYPLAAKAGHIGGDVFLDVTLREDGTVAEVTTVEGDPLLIGAASTAVRQYRYRPLIVNRKPVDRFVVTVSFKPDA